MRLLLTLLVALRFAGGAQQQRVEGWQRDMDELAEKVRSVHVNPFKHVSQEEFEASVAQLKSQAGDLSDAQTVAEIVRLVASLKDGHSFAEFPQNTSYPVMTYIFNDGHYVIGGVGEFKEVLGWKLVAIAERSLREVYECVTPYINHDNSAGIRQLLPYFMIRPQVLIPAGVLDREHDAAFTFESDKGERKTIKTNPMPTQEFFHLLHAEQAAGPVPLWRRNNRQYYWFEYLEDQKALYLQYNFILNDPHYPMTSLASDLDSLVRTRPVEKFIIDNRNNQGGDITTTRDLINFIRRNKTINRRGVLFMIIGRRTVSAAAYVAAELERNTKVTFVGEPNGAPPNFFADTRLVTLTHSGVKVHLSRRYHENSFSFDKRLWFEPDIRVDPTYASYRRGEDQALDAALAWKAPSLPKLMPSDTCFRSLSGRYLLDPKRIIEIGNSTEGVTMDIAGFLHSNLYHLSVNRFATDMPGIEVELLNEPPRIALHVRDTTLYPIRLVHEYHLPLELLLSGHAQKAVELLRTTRVRKPGHDDVQETALNALGYRLLRDRVYKAAIAVFRLNIKFHPHSWNAYDSLGEAYLMVGDLKLARTNYEKSLSINPDNKNGKAILERLPRDSN